MELQELLDQLRRDPVAREEFRALFSGQSDAIDVLAWRIDPRAPGYTGSPAPGARRRALERVVHARPTGPAGEQAREQATVELLQLIDVQARDDAALDNALAAFSTAHPTPEATDEPGLLSDDGPAEGMQPELGYVRGRWFALAAAGVLVAVGLLAAATQGGRCPGVSCAPAASPTATAPTQPATELIGFAALWDFYMRDYPDAVRPELPVIRFATDAETPAVLVDCMHAAGYPEVRLAGVDGVSHNELPDDRMEGFGEAMYSCRVQYPADPLAVFDRPQAEDEKLYETTSTALLLQHPNPGTVRTLLDIPGYHAIAFRLDDANPEDPMVCVQLQAASSGESSGTCETVEQFRLQGLRPSGLIWSPNGDLRLTAHG
ncbi:hypothetical protein BH11ACT4_BH11ACT4_17370 [soil metagenome]